jgi:MFS family permease
MDKKATPAIRGQVQGFFVLIANGVGMLIGAQVTGRVYNTFLGQADALSLASWQTFWTHPAVFALMVLLMFAMTFKEKK